MATTTLFHKANEAFVSEDYDAALALYSEAIAQGGGSDELFCSRAQAHIKLANYKEAEADADQALALNPDNPKAYMRKGIASYSLEDYELALKTFMKGMMLEGEDKKFETWVKKCEEALEMEKKRLEAPESASQLGKLNSEQLSWSVSPDTKVEYSCGLCGFSSQLKSRMYKHFYQHLPRDLWPWTCPFVECEWYGRFKSDFQRTHVGSRRHRRAAEDHPEIDGSEAMEHNIHCEDHLRAFEQAMKVTPIGSKKATLGRKKATKKSDMEDSDQEVEDSDGIEAQYTSMLKQVHGIIPKTEPLGGEDPGNHEYISDGPDAEDSTHSNSRIMDVPRTASKRKAAMDNIEPHPQVARMDPEAIKAWVESAVEKAVNSRLGTRSRANVSVRNRVADLIDEFFDVLAPLHEHADGSSSYSPGCDKCVDMDSLLSAIVEATDPRLLHSNKPPELHLPAEQADIIL